jgi:hypothetical protein
VNLYTVCRVDPPDRAVRYGQAWENALRFPHPPAGWRLLTTFTAPQQQ